MPHILEDARIMIILISSMFLLDRNKMLWCLFHEKLSFNDWMLNFTLHNSLYDDLLLNNGIKLLHNLTLADAT